MNTRKPPKLAIWMLNHFGCSPDTEILIGDLLERYEQEQRRFWFWSQVIKSIAGGFVEEALTHKEHMVRGMAAGWAGVLLFRGGVLEIVTNALYYRQVNPSDFEPIVRNGTVVGFALPTPWGFIYPTAFLVSTLICMAISGRIAARAGGAHRKAAVLTYAGSLFFVAFINVGPILAVDLLDPTERQIWRSLGIICLNVAAVLVAGLWTRSSRANPQQPQVNS